MTDKVVDSEVTEEEIEEESDHSVDLSEVEVVEVRSSHRSWQVLR